MLITFKKPSRHLRDGLDDEIVYRHKARIFVVKLDSAGYLCENLGYLGKIFPRCRVDCVRHNVEGFGRAVERLVRRKSAAHIETHTMAGLIRR